MNVGDSVIVNFDGVDHPGEIIIPPRNGWVRARILTDPDLDYGSITPRLAPISEVIVRETRVRKAEQ